MPPGHLPEQHQPPAADLHDLRRRLWARCHSDWLRWGVPRQLQLFGPHLL
jgi:hypothetical protein